MAYFGSMTPLEIPRRELDKQRVRKLLAWWGAGFVTGLVLLGGFALYAARVGVS